jgi:hypothetical protein
MHELLRLLLLHQSSQTPRHILHQLWNSKRWMLLVMEKGFLPLVDVRGLILGMLVTFSYAQVAMYVFGLCDIRPVTKEVR